MVSPAVKDAEGPRWRERLGIAIEWAGWTAAIGGPLVYALGRLMADIFLRRFGVVPEEVGITYSSLVLPAAILTALAAAVVVVLVMAGRLAYLFGGVAVVWLLLWFV